MSGEFDEYFDDMFDGIRKDVMNDVEKSGDGFGGKHRQCEQEAKYSVEDLLGIKTMKINGKVYTVDEEIQSLLDDVNGAGLDAFLKKEANDDEKADHTVIDEIRKARDFSEVALRMPMPSDIAKKN